ncbi:MAG TPA: Gfo/Idh/MocA family oxidoreductase, partial [Solirubrobacteraceae bacterium]
ASHAELAAAALHAGKHVFVEKPPGLSAAELDELRAAQQAGGGVLATGFNRRHAPLARRLRDHVAGRGQPVELLLRVNAGRLPAGHWLNDLDDGGGRLLGEGCHFVDLACWVAGALPERVECVMGAGPGQPLAAAQTFAVSLGFADGSVATILYGAGGASGLGKEYVEAHAGGRSAVLDDFKSLELVTGRKRETHKGRGKDKGHRAQFHHLRARIEGRAAPEGPDALDTMAVTLAALAAARGER